MSHNILLFPELEKDLRELRSTGLFPSQKIQEFIQTDRIQASAPITGAQIQPASLDLRLGPIAYRVRASFLPGKSFAVEDKVRDFGMSEIDLRTGAVFEKYCTYV